MRVHPDDRKKKYHAKSRHGCISCKRRHLKCDEAKPQCRRCVKDFGKCEGYHATEAWVFNARNDDFNTIGLEVDNTSPGSSSTSSTSGSNRSRTQSTASTGIASGSQDSSASSETEHIRQKRWAPKSRSGCLTCKRRRIKCDEGRPSCSRCIASGRECEYAHVLPDEASDGVSGVEEVDIHDDSDTSSGLRSINDVPYKTQIEHQTFVHWQGRTESCMVISRSFGNFNILGCELPKAAWSYSCLRHGLLSAASVTASIEKFAVGDYNERQAVIEAVKQSSLAIKDLLEEKPPPEVVVLVAFVFWFMEAWIGSWDRAVMHLASAARMCEQGFAQGQVSEAVAWYVGVCDVGVPQALRTPEILKLVQNLNQDYDEKFHIRLIWGTREAINGIRLLAQAKAKALQFRPEACKAFNFSLSSHQAQMRFLSDRWKQYARLQLTKIEDHDQLPSPPAVPTYSKVMEMAEYFLTDDERYDALVLEVRLKMIQRSLPLFIAGSNVEIRRDAAMSIPIRFNPDDTELDAIASSQISVAPRSKMLSETLHSAQTSWPPNAADAEVLSRS